MIVIAIGLILLQLQKEQLDKKRKITVLKNSFKKRVLFCCFKTKETCFFKKTFVLKQAHISSGNIKIWDVFGHAVTLTFDPKI